ncbi:DUF2029 domain-containing protein [Oscillochloris sp. ZM17-4]|uniref:glycosyltransferase family 87 protein n=1 Tax=Oscillochloris sp. ZM17-4 TaxID=2866714 RepID=UPI001C73463E|nr:glycosyltransferase family 87 protein [Oscillochloris sp. ZM17-4]MBX0327903.1 DUF2029 domain-containing protein [Oscillochloris sp. ZM17-4]
MRQLLTILSRALRPTTIALPAALLAGIATICLLFSATPRRYDVMPDRLRFTGKAIDAGLHNLEHSADPTSPMSYRWTNGAARIILPNPGGPLELRLELAAGNGRRIDALILTANNSLPITVGPGPRVYRMLLRPERDELVALRIESPTFSEPGGARQLGVIVAEVGVIGGGWPTDMVLVSALLSGLALYLLAIRWLPPRLAAGGALAAQTMALAWESGSGWPQGIFASLEAIGVAVVALAALALELAQPGGIGPRSAARPAVRVMAARAAMVAIFLVAAIWTQVVVVPGLASDLVVYLRAAARSLSGGDPYQPFLIGASYVYPPPALALFGPLTALTQPDAQAFWRLLSALAIIGSILSLRRAFAMAVPVPLGTTWLLALAASFAPLWESLTIGQVNALVLLGISLFILGYRDRRWAWAGDLGLAGAIMLKISPLLLLALPLLRRDWPRCLRVSLGLLGLSLLALPWFGPQLWVGFLAIVPQLLQGGDANPYNLSLSAMGFRLGPSAALIGRLLAAALPLLWLLLCLRDRRGDPRPLLALGVLVMMIGSNLVWYHHLVFLAVPLAWLLIGTTVGGPALAGLIGLSLVQLAGPATFVLGLGPWAAAAGYLTLFGATLAGMRRAAEPDLI